MLVGQVVARGGDVDQLAGRGVTAEVQRSLGRVESAQPADELVAVPSPLWPHSLTASGGLRLYFGLSSS